MSIPFDNLDSAQRDDVLRKMSLGIDGIRRDYTLAAQALTTEEREARTAQAQAARLGMMQQLDALGLIGWYQEQQ